MPFEKHRTLETPHGSTFLWRYMDLPKFVQMLETRSLWFARADKFEDPFEGTLTDGEIGYRRAYSQSGDFSAVVALDALQAQVRGLRFTRATSYVNCWRKGESESIAMWDLYGKGGGVAIVSQVDRLIAQLTSHPASFTIASVKYVDWSAPPYSAIGDWFEYVARKDKSYEHESEVRVIYSDSPIERSVIADSRNIAVVDQEINRLSRTMPPGKSVEIDPQTLIREVVIGPRERPWLEGLLKKLIARYGISVPVRSSDRLLARREDYDIADFERISPPSDLDI